MPGWIMEHNGTDWIEGTPSRWNGRAAHDVAVDKGGNVWFADDATPERTLGKLDDAMFRKVILVLLLLAGAGLIVPRGG